MTFVQASKSLGWDTVLQVPQSLKNQVLEIKSLMDSWKGRPFQEKFKVRTFHSDSSTIGWGGLDVDKNQTIQEFWRQDQNLHINVKELIAGVKTIMSLGRPGDHINLCVDNVVAFHYLRKGGGRLQHLNVPLQNLWRWLMTNSVTMTVTLVPSKEQKADYLTRGLDRGDYTLDMTVYRLVTNLLTPWVRPQWDMFASPGNAKLPLFVSRWNHHQASLTDSLNCPLQGISQCYANLPWKLIGPWLHRLKLHPHLTCLMICPLWVSAPWWPLLIRMQVPHSRAIKVLPREGLFINCLHHPMPPTRWPLLCVIR